MISNVTNLVNFEQNSGQPMKETASIRDGDEYKPKPDVYVDFLIEQIDRENTLDRVTLYVRQDPDAEVAQRHTRKPSRLSKVLLMQQLPDNLNPIKVIVAPEKGVEQEQLSEHVEQVDQLDYDIQRGQVIAIASTTDDAAVSGDKMFAVGPASSAISTCLGEVSGYVFGHVPYCRVPTLHVGCILYGHGSLHYIVQVDTTFTVEETP